MRRYSARYNTRSVSSFEEAANYCKTANTINVLTPMRINYQSASHIPVLDSLRGLAVLLVILFHCFPHPVTTLGWVGVDLFFVLSGFLITGILIDSKGKKGYYRNFIARRTLRIFPLYFFALLICLVLLPLFFHSLLSPDYAYYLQHQGWFWLYGQNWLFSITGFPKDHTLVHFWSLAVEEQFYVFWPLVVAVCSRRKLIWVCLFLIVFCLFFRFYLGERLGLIDPFRYMATAARMDALLIGALIAIFIRTRKELLERFTLPVALISVAAIAAGILYSFSLHFIRLSSIYLFIDIAAGCLLILLLSNYSDFFALRWLKHRSFKWLGKYSYGLYVYHYIIFNLIRYNLEDQVNVISGNKWLTMLAIGGVSVALSFIISVVSFKYLEMPFLKLKKYF